MIRFIFVMVVLVALSLVAQLLAGSAGFGPKMSFFIGCIVSIAAQLLTPRSWFYDHLPKL